MKYRICGITGRFNRNYIQRSGRMGKEPDSIFFEFGRRIGYWLAANQHTFLQRMILSVVYKLPGGKWLSQLLK